MGDETTVGETLRQLAAQVARLQQQQESLLMQQGAVIGLNTDDSYYDEGAGPQARWAAVGDEFGVAPEARPPLGASWAAADTAGDGLMTAVSANIGNLLASPQQQQHQQHPFISVDPSQQFAKQHGTWRANSTMRHHEVNLQMCITFFFAIMIFWTGFSQAVKQVKVTPKARALMRRFGFYEYMDHGGTLQEKATCMRLILSHSSKDLSTIIADASGVPGQVLTAFTFVAAILVTTVDFSQVNYIRTDGTQLLYLVLNFLRKLSLLSLIAVLTFPLPPVEKLWTMYNDSWEKKQMTRAQLKFLVRTEPIQAFMQSQLHYLAAASISMLAPIHLVMLTIDLVQFFMELPHYSKSYSPADSKTGEFYDFMNGKELHKREPPNFLLQKGGSRCSAHFWQYNPFAAFMYCAFPAWAIWLVLSVQRLVIIVLNLHTATRVMEHFSAARPGAKATMQGFRSEIEFFKSMLRECACAAIAGLFAPYASYDCYSFFYYKISALLNPEFSQESNGLTAGQNALQTFNIVQNIFTRMILVALAFWLILGNVPWFVWRFRLVARDFDYTDEELAHLFDSSWAKHEEQIEELILDQFVKNPDQEDELEPSDEELEEGEKDEKVKDGYNRAADRDLLGGDHEQLFFKDLEDVHDEGRRRETNSDKSDEQDEDLHKNADEQMDKQKPTSSTGKFVLRDLDRSRTGETGAPAPDTASGQQLLLGGSTTSAASKRLSGTSSYPLPLPAPVVTGQPLPPNQYASACSLASSSPKNREPLQAQAEAPGDVTPPGASTSAGITAAARARARGRMQRTLTPSSYHSGGGQGGEIRGGDYTNTGGAPRAPPSASLDSYKNSTAFLDQLEDANRANIAARQESRRDSQRSLSQRGGQGPEGNRSGRGAGAGAGQQRGRHGELIDTDYLFEDHTSFRRI